LASAPNPQYVELLYRALAAPIGIAVLCSDATRARNSLYVARAKLADPLLDRLQVRVNPLLPAKELWLIKTPEAPKAPPKPAKFDLSLI
jgi:hypothetical protein